MDRNQAEAVARAILEPATEARKELRRKRQQQARALLLQRRAAAVALLGMSIGGAIGHFAFAQGSRGFIAGGIAAYLLTRLLQARTA